MYHGTGGQVVPLAYILGLLAVKLAITVLTIRGYNTILANKRFFFYITDHVIG
jgi:hypothetical protein